jgi:hypothetical protein
VTPSNILGKVPIAGAIYDSRARQSIAEEVPRLNQIPDIETDSYDQEYKDLIRCCVWLPKKVKICSSGMIK